MLIVGSYCVFCQGEKLFLRLEKHPKIQIQESNYQVTFQTLGL